jgi:hypothetical protein
VVGAQRSSLLAELAYVPAHAVQDAQDHDQRLKVTHGSPFGGFGRGGLAAAGSNLPLSIKGPLLFCLDVKQQLILVRHGRDLRLELGRLKLQVPQSARKAVNLGQGFRVARCKLVVLHLQTHGVVLDVIDSGRDAILFLLDTQRRLAGCLDAFVPLRPQPLGLAQQTVLRVLLLHGKRLLDPGEVFLLFAAACLQHVDAVHGGACLRLDDGPVLNAAEGPSKLREVPLHLAFNLLRAALHNLGVASQPLKL